MCSITRIYMIQVLRSISNNEVAGPSVANRVQREHSYYI
jgi:hypothetical protein